MAVLEIRVRGRLAERQTLGFVEPRRGGRIEAAGIFPLRAENQREEFRRQFVMLSIGVFRVDRNGESVHLVTKSASAEKGVRSSRCRLRDTSQSMPARVTGSGSGARSAARIAAATMFMAVPPQMAERQTDPLVAELPAARPQNFSRRSKTSADKDNYVCRTGEVSSAIEILGSRASLRARWSSKRILG